MKTLTKFLGILLISVSFGLENIRAAANGLPYLKTVFIIMMENELWQDVYFSTNAPYLTDTLIPQASYCLSYANIMHPSEPNYIWLEAGSNLGITDSNDPFANHRNTTNHLTTQLNNAGIAWKSYQEDISGDIVPLFYTNLYAPRHNPFVYFDDVTGTNNLFYPYGIAHIRPYTELAADLARNTVARYNFITPNLTDDMHNLSPPLYDLVLQGDTWLSTEIPKIMASPAYQNNGAIFILWDETSNGTEGNIPMLVLSPLAKGNGYASTNLFTHSSTLRTMQEIFGVGPFLGDAANAEDLSDLFIPPKGGGNGPPVLTTVPQGLGIYNFAKNNDGTVQFDINGCISGKTHVVQISTDMVNWSDVGTNVVSGGGFTFNDATAVNNNQRFYRVVQLP